MSYYELESRIADLEKKIEDMEKEKLLREAYEVLKRKKPLTYADKLVLSLYQKFHKTVDMSLEDAMHILFYDSGYCASLRGLRDVSFDEYGGFFDIDMPSDRRKRDSRLLKKIQNPEDIKFEDIILRDFRLGDDD